MKFEGGGGRPTSRTSWSYTPLVTCGKRSLTPSLVMVGVLVVVVVVLVVLVLGIL